MRGSDSYLEVLGEPRSSAESLAQTLLSDAAQKVVLSPAMQPAGVAKAQNSPCKVRSAGDPDPRFKV